MRFYLLPCPYKLGIMRNPTLPTLNTIEYVEYNPKILSTFLQIFPGERIDKLDVNSGSDIREAI